MKNYSLGWFSLIFFVIITSFTFTSCSDDDATDPNSGQIISPDTEVDDPIGTISLSMHNESNGKTFINNNFYIDDGNNFAGSLSSYFASIGRVKGLGNVSDIPVAGWAHSVSVTPGYGYVGYHVYENNYYRIYVDDYITSVGGGIIGADIKYQTPFKGKDEAISLKEHTLNFPSSGGSQALVFGNKSIVLFDCVSSADWCHVQRSTTYDQPFLYNGVMITVDSSDQKSSSEAVVTLTTVYGKTVEVKVTRSGAEPFIKFETGERKQIDAKSNVYTEGILTNYLPKDLEVSCDADWCKVSLQDNTNALALAMHNIKSIEGKPVTRAYTSNSGVISCNVLLNVEENKTTEERQCEVIVRSKDNKTSAILTIIQTDVKFSISATELVVKANGGTKSIKYTSSLTGKEISAESNVEWCTVVVDDPTGGYLYVSYEDNKSLKEREAIITITNRNDNKILGTIELKQEATNFVIQNTEAIMNATGGTISIRYTSLLTANELETACDEEWCTVKVDDPNVGFLYLSCEENRTLEDRTALIRISSKIDNDIIGTINLTQKGCTFVPSKEHVWFDRKSQILTINISTDMTTLPGVASDATWCTCSTNGKQLTIRVTDATEERECLIKFDGINKAIKVTQSKYAEGDEYSEDGLTGIVAFMEDGQRFIAKEVGSVVWSTEYVSTGATDQNNGINNMEIIKQIPNWKTLYPAFALCEDLNKDGVTGWYLPAVNELIRSINRIRSGTPWSSSESNNRLAYCIRDLYYYSWSLDKSETHKVYAFHKF